MTGRAFEALGGKSVFQGRIIEARVERFRFADGEEVEREIVRHPGAAGVVPVEGDHVWLVRQPREAVGDPDVLEIPAGRLDVAGESPLEAAKRELVEEIGRAADRWTHLTSFWSSVGMTDEEVHLYLAEGLTEAVPESEPEHDERIELVPWRLDDLDAAIAATRDAKTLIGLLMLQARTRDCS